MKGQNYAAAVIGQFLLTLGHFENLTKMQITNGQWVWLPFCGS